MSDDGHHGPAIPGVASVPPRHPQPAGEDVILDSASLRVAPVAREDGVTATAILGGGDGGTAVRAEPQIRARDGNGWVWRATNLHVGGAVVVGVPYLTPGTVLPISIELEVGPGDRIGVDALARVEWSNDPAAPSRPGMPAGMGLAFGGMADAGREALRALLRQYRHVDDPNAAAVHPTRSDRPGAPELPSDGLQPGTVIGSYLIDRLAGLGGMAEVYLGTHQTLGMKVALKRLRPKVARDPTLIERFFEEARRHSRIRHPNIVAITDFVSEGDNHLFVMEFLVGKPLDEYIDLRKGEPMPLPEVLHVGLQLCSALEAVHAANVVHRDLKPSNVFLTAEPGKPVTVKLLDFGIAKFIDAETGRSVNQTAAGLVVGTPGYMAPEQVLAGKVTARSDIYNIGLILFEMVTGRPPFVGDDVSDLMRMHAVDTAPRATAVTKRPVPPRLEALLISCLAKKPAHRPESVARVRAELQLLAAGETEAPPNSLPPLPVPPEARAGRRRLWAAAAVLVAIAAAAWWMLGAPGLPPAYTDRVSALEPASSAAVIAEPSPAPDTVGAPGEPVAGGPAAVGVPGGSDVGAPREAEQTTGEGAATATEVEPKRPLPPAGKRKKKAGRRAGGVPSSGESVFDIYE